MGKRAKPERHIHVRAVAEIRAEAARRGQRVWLFHAANESDVPAHYRAELAALGVAPGVPDIVVVNPLPFGPRGWVNEIKAPRGRLTEDQHEWLGAFARCGFEARCTYGHRETANAWREWGHITYAAVEAWLAWAARLHPDAL